MNIPRYVDTFEEEEIDLDTVAQEIRAIDGEMVEPDRLIRGVVKS